MGFIQKHGLGIGVCLAIAFPSWLLGKAFPVVGGAVIAIVMGMVIAMFWNDKGKAEAGIKWTSKMILQSAVVLLGFGMNLGVIFQTGKQSLPIIVCTITTSLLIAWILKRVLHIHRNTAVLVGVGSSICGGSAIAASAPVIEADEDEIAQAMCQAELVHETIVILSFVPVAFSAVFGAFWVFLITSLCAAAFDLMFVIIQRYNRPRIIRLIKHR